MTRPGVGHHAPVMLEEAIAALNIKPKGVYVDGTFGRGGHAQRILDALDAEEWEALCDGCAKCCLLKLEDEDTGEIAYTKLHCRLLDGQACACMDYENRKNIVEDCVILTPQNVAEIQWMPRTCAYRLLAEGRALPDWHPLVSGDPESVHRAGISVRDKAISEVNVHPDDIDYYAIGYRI